MLKCLLLSVTRSDLTHPLDASGSPFLLTFPTLGYIRQVNFVTGIQ